MQGKENTSILEKIIGPLTTSKAIQIIIIVGAIVYFNVLFNGFVWDDWANFLYNPALTNSNLISLFGKNTINTAIFYRPIVAVYLVTLFGIFGTNALSYHFLQIAMHLVNACLFFYFSKRFINTKIALYISLIFLVHPIQVESVAWITQTMIPLSLLFGFLSIILSIKENTSNRTTIIIFFLLLLSVLTRETGFLFFPLILILQIFLRKNAFFKFLLTEILVMFSYLFIRFFAGGVSLVSNFYSPLGHLSYLQRMVNLPAISFYYIKTFFFPHTLAIDQLWIVKQISFYNFYLPLLGNFIFFASLFAISIYIYRFRKKYLNIYLFFFSWFFIGFLTVLQIIPVDMTVADRYFYFPLIGLLGMLGVILQIINFGKFLKKEIIIFSLITILVLLSFRTILRNQDWHSYFGLVSHDIKIEDNFDTEGLYGSLLALEKNNNKEALKHFERSVDMYPYEANIKNVGAVYSRLGNKQKALEYFYKALNATSFSQQGKHNLSTYQALSNFLFQEKNYKETARISAEALKDYPDTSDLWILLAVSEYNLNNQPDALLAAKRAYNLSPNQQTLYLYTQILKKQKIIIE